MWLILRLEGLGKCLSRVECSKGRVSAPSEAILIFIVYGYFWNLVISKVIINTLICNFLSVIMKSLSRHSRGCRNITEPHKICVFLRFFLDPNFIIFITRIRIVGLLFYYPKKKTEPSLARLDFGLGQCWLARPNLLGLSTLLMGIICVETIFRNFQYHGGQNWKVRRVAIVDFLLQILLKVMF